MRSKFIFIFIFRGGKRPKRTLGIWTIIDKDQSVTRRIELKLFFQLLKGLTFRAWTLLIILQRSFSYKISVNGSFS